ncbi:MAG: hypothetical protein AAB091_01075 [Elusimicrobiota bacterium]
MKVKAFVFGICIAAACLDVEASPPSVVEDLIRSAQNSGETIDVRAAAIYALRRHFAFPEAREAVVRLADKDSNLPIRWISLRILGRAAWDLDTKRFLARKVEKESNEPLKVEAIRSLGFVLSDDSIYRSLLNEFNRAVALPIKYSLTKSLYYAVLQGNAEALRKVRETARDPDPVLRKAAIETLSGDSWVFAHWICPDNPVECSPAHHDPYRPPPPYYK